MLKTINGGKMPTRATKYSAGIDLYSNEDITIGAGETAIVGLGVCIDINLFIKKNYAFFTQPVGLFTLDAIPKLEFRQKLVDNFLNSHYLELHPRSSLRAKGLNASVGVIDLDFEQEIKIIIHNPLALIDGICSDEIIYKEDFRKSFTIKKGDKIAQILLKEYKGYLMGIETEEERSGGIGSSGK